MTEEECKSEAIYMTGGYAQRVATQLLVTSGDILVGNSRG